MSNDDVTPLFPAELLPAELSGGLIAEPATSDALGNAGVHLANVAYHDFAAYEYLFDPWAETVITSPDLSNEEKEIVDRYLKALY